MPQGRPLTVPADGLSTRARRNAPLLAVHTGPGKGKSTAAFGMALRAWNQGFDIAVFQFVKSAKWKVGEEAASRENRPPRGSSSPGFALPLAELWPEEEVGDDSLEAHD